MADSRAPIAVPWRVRASHWATKWAQGSLFLFSGVALIWMWTRQAPEFVVTGQVEAVRVEVPATSDGILMPFDPPLVPFDRVHKDVTLVARFDVADALMEMTTMTAERERLQALIHSETERLRLEQRRWDLQQEERLRDSRQQTLTIQRTLASSRQRVDDLHGQVGDVRQRQRDLARRQQELQSAIGSLSLEIANLRSRRQRLDELVSRRLATPFQLTEIDQEIELKIAGRLQNEQLLGTLGEQSEALRKEAGETESRLQQAQRLLAEATVPPAEVETGSDATLVDIETSLQPLIKALAVQDAKVRQAAQRVAANEIRAPVSGMISKIHHPPGTFVRDGEPVVTIAASDVRWIVAYVDQRFGQLLRKDDRVQVRVRGKGGAVGQAVVSEVGLQYQPVPDHLRRIREVPQWGLPVKISVPADFVLVPGELVDLVFAAGVGHSSML